MTGLGRRTTETKRPRGDARAGSSDSDGVPAWVSNVKTPSRTRLATAIRVVRCAHRLLVKGLVVALAFALLWSWLGPTGDHTLALRIACTVAALLVVPVALLIWIDPPTSMFMLSTRLGLWGTDGRARPVTQEFVGIGRIAKPMLLAVLVTEDAYFFWHVGFDPIEIWNAFQYNRKRRKPGGNLRGASTLTQQMTKNLFLLPTQSYLRKIAEAFLTAIVEGLWTKRRILEVYLNIVQFGEGIFGVEAAAKHFFGKSAAALTADEAALLAVALRGPRLYRVDAPPPAMLKAKAETLQRMSWCGEDMLEQLDNL
jgi:monofunctional biosynthetic peptidoglycan transglycosylase